MSTRRAYGVALAKLGQASQRVVALDGDTKNSTFSETFKKAFPERYIECFIAEQNMVQNSVIEMKPQASDVLQQMLSQCNVFG